MPESLYTHVSRDDTLFVSDNGGANTYTVEKWPGDFASESPMYGTTFILDNGEHDCPRRADAQNTTLSWSVHSRDIGSAAHATMPDLCKWRDAAVGSSFVDANWISTLLLKSDVLAADVARTVDGTWKGEADKTETYLDVILRGSHASGNPSIFSVSGTSAHLTPTI